MLKRRSCSGEGGQELVEFALILPLLLLLILGMIELAVVMFHHNTLSNAAREGARVGVIAGATEEQVLDAVAARGIGLGLCDCNVDVDFDDTENTVTVTIVYDHRPLTGALLWFFGKDQVLPMRAVCTMRRETG